MSAVLIPTRRNALARLWRSLRADVLRLWITNDERYLAECEASGLSDSLDLEAFRKQVQTMRRKLIELETT